MAGKFQQGPQQGFANQDKNSQGPQQGFPVNRENPTRIGNPQELAKGPDRALTLDENSCNTALVLHSCFQRSLTIWHNKNTKW